jgi:hypothetical protein
MAASDARPVPRKNTAFRVYFPILDNDGDPVTAAAGLDSEVSKDGAAFADCTNEATEIGSSGIYYLDLTSTEMNADAVVVIVKTSTTDAKTAPIVMYPAPAADVPTSTTIADALLTRDMSAVTEGSGRTPLQALRLLRNKWSISGGTLTVTKEDDSTSSWTGTTTGTPGVTTVDPA